MPLGAQDVTQGFAVDELHHDVRQRPLGGGRLAGVEDLDDRRMVEGRRILRLTPEAQVERGVAGQIGAQHLDGHIAVQEQVTREVDLGHAAETEGLAQFVSIRDLPGVGHQPPSCGSGCALVLASSSPWPSWSSLSRAGRPGI